MASKKRKPWRKFYPTDYLGDPQLASCSFGAQGLWVRLMCVAWLSCREGFVVRPDGSAITPDDIASGYIVSLDTPGRVRAYMDELVSKQVCSIDEETGAIVSRRIVRDAEAAEQARINGSKGGNPVLVGGSDKGVDKGGDNQGDKGGGYPRSAYASASAFASGSEGESEGEDAPPGTTFMAYWFAYPARLRTRQNEALTAWCECMAEGHDPAVIVAKAAEYGASHQGRSEYAVRAPRFLEARMFLDPPEAWQDASEGPQKPKRDYSAVFAEGDE